MCNKINEFTDERIDLMQGFKYYTITLCVLYYTKTKKLNGFGSYGLC